MKRFCLALDLVDEPGLIAEYEEYHKAVWPEILASIHQAGIHVMEIYRAGNRLFMIIEAADDFTFEGKSRADAGNPKVQEWESLMWKYQQAIPDAAPGEKWTLMKRIFQTQA